MKPRYPHVALMGMDDLIIARAEMSALQREIVSLGDTIPKIIMQEAKNIEQAYQEKRRAMLEHDLEMAKLKRSRLTTREEQRTDTDAEIARIEALLNPPTVK